jgi:Tfp pilus assembly protein PilF
VAAVTAVVFAPALQNGFVNWDDSAMVVDNPGYRAPGWGAIRYAFTSTWFTHYHPLTWLSFTLDWRLWGASPAGFHLTNVVLHSITSALTFVVMRRLLAIARGTGGIAVDVGALVGALSFAVHPLRVEAVAWVTARRDVLCGFFVLLTLVAYLRAVSLTPRDGGVVVRPRTADVWADRPARGWLAVAVVFYAAALLSKAVAMTLPVLLVIMDRYPLRRRAWWEKVPFVVLGGASAAAAASVVWTADGFTHAAAYGVVARLALAGYSLAYYVWATVLPIGLSPLREIPAHVDPLARPFLLGVIGVLAGTALAILVRRRLPSVTAGWAAYVVTVLPTSGLTHAGLQLVYDRYSYLPALVWGALLGGGVAAVVTAWRGGRMRTPFAAALVTATVVMLIGWSHLSRGQIEVWRNSETLWTAALRADPACAMCRSNLAVTLADRGKLEDAERELRIAVFLRPGFSQPRANLGSVLFELGLVSTRAGRHDEAVRYFTEAAVLLPDHPGVLRRLADARAAASGRSD